MSSSPSPSFFMLGASGYLGGSLLKLLVETYPRSTFTLLYRSPSQEEPLKSVSPKQIKLLQGDLDSTDVITKAAKESDFTINCADCDHLPSVKATLKGLRWRTENGKLARYVHTSGGADLVDDGIPLGEQDPKLYDDTNSSHMAALPPNGWHRHVDNEILSELEKKSFYGYIILPFTVYGKGSGPLHQLSVQIPNTVRYALNSGKASYIGRGENLWKSVHIDDLSQLYLKVIALVLKEEVATTLPNLPSPSIENSLIFAASPNAFRWRDITIWIAQVLNEKKQPGILKTEGDLVASITKDEDGKGLLTGTNSVGSSSRALDLFGWKTRDVKKEDIEWEVSQILKEADQ